MDAPTLLIEHPEFPITVRQYGKGATAAGEQRGISVIIDNFRASNTILALLEAGARVKPVEKIKEVLTYDDFIKVGEQGGKKHSAFDYDNSPYTVSQNQDIFKDRNVVIRTTNGTRGIIKAGGSKATIIGSFRNLTAVVEFCLDHTQHGTPVSFVAMGSKDIARIEDYFGAKMMFYKLVERLDTGNKSMEKLLASYDNPWNLDWQEKIKEVREFNDSNIGDRTYSIQLDQTEIIPKYNQETGFLEIL